MRLPQVGCGWKTLWRDKRAGHDSSLLRGWFKMSLSAYLRPRNAPSVAVKPGCGTARKGRFTAVRNTRPAKASSTPLTRRRKSLLSLSPVSQSRINRLRAGHVFCYVSRGSEAAPRDCGLPECYMHCVLAEQSDRPLPHLREESVRHITSVKTVPGPEHAPELLCKQLNLRSMVQIAMAVP